MTWNQKKKKGGGGLEKQSNLIFKNKTWTPAENHTVSSVLLLLSFLRRVMFGKFNIADLC